MCLEEFVDENGTVPSGVSGVPVVSGNFIAFMWLYESFSITAISVDVIFYRQNWLRAGPKNSQTYHCSDSHNHSPDLQAQWQLRTIYVDIHQEHPRWKKTKF